MDNSDRELRARVTVLEDREFSHRITLLLLMDPNLSRAWTDTFLDQDKISDLEGFVLDQNRSRLVLPETQGSYRSVVYFEKKQVIKEGLLVADTVGQVRFQVSNDGGQTWINVSPGERFTFSRPDRRLCLRAKARGAGAEIRNVALLW